MIGLPRGMGFAGGPVFHLLEVLVAYCEEDLLERSDSDPIFLKTILCHEVVELIEQRSKAACIL